jgi:hypothetical protein
MRKVNVIAIMIAVLLVGQAFAACPDRLGTWSSIPESNPDFPLLNGRVSEAWCNGAPGDPGNTQNAMSWDGADLGLEWKLFGMAINAAGPYLVFDGVDGNGNGTRIYQTDYDDGEFWLGGSGDWTFGDVDLFGQVVDYLVVTTQTLQAGEVVASVSNITFRGPFDDCAEANGCRIDFAIANAALAWMSGDADPMPANFPPFLCSADLGELHTTSDITLAIDCNVATEAHSWSDVKAIYE